jgi:CRP/FNR family transcriptional regulator, anaerobic regulatory protein
MSIAATATAVKPAPVHHFKAVGAIPFESNSDAGGTTSAVSCSKCCLRGICLPRGLDADSLGHMDQLTRLKRKVARGATLYRTGDHFDAVYAVRSGAFKSVGISRNGLEKVTGLHLPGEVMGLEAISTRKHRYEAIALEDSEVCVIPFAQLTQLALRLPELQAQLLRTVSGDISRDQALMLLLGSLDAEQRLAAFLLSLSKRYQNLGYSPTRFSLRMTREEIGSYLGLTLETVSRVMSRLNRNGVIKAQQRDIELKDHQALEEKVGHW